MGVDHYDAIVGGYRPRVEALCRRVLDDPEDAEDAVEETLLHLREALPRFWPPPPKLSVHKELGPGRNRGMRIDWWHDLVMEEVDLARSDLRDRMVHICEGLPDVAVTRIGDHVRFQVRNKTFAWYTHDEHGDGRIALVYKAEPGEQEALIAMDPDRFYKPPYLGPRGWVAARLDVDTVDWGEIAELALQAYRLVAPKQLRKAAQLPTM
jgi:hypothetical protein